ncbi:MAG TPA: beta-ketoacyl-[acyl-carrier-protein] synthase family protein [Polyangia bacterium]
MRRAAITGIGAVSGFGAGVERLWSALLGGRRAMAERDELARAGIKAGPVALYPDLPLDAPARAIQLALIAAREALSDAGDPPRGARLGVTCGTTLGAIGGWLRAVRTGGSAPRRFGHAGPAQAVAEEARAGGPVEVASVACASGNAALGMALDLVREETCDVVLAGGVDALNDFVLSGFACLKALDSVPCRPFDRRRHGLNLGEGAGFLVVESEAHARARGARIRAFLDGYGLSADAVHMTGPDREGRGAARSMLAALADAKLPPERLDFVSAHGTATVFNDLMESRALAQVLGARAATTPVNSIKSALGHTLGAAGALEAILCVRTLETGLLAPTAGLEELDPEIALDVVRGQPRALAAVTALSTSSGFGGTNAAVLLRRANG